MAIRAPGWRVGALLAATVLLGCASSPVGVPVAPPSGLLGVHVQLTVQVSGD